MIALQSGADCFLSGWAILPLAPCIGSYLGVLLRRLPQGRPVAAARSACEHCGHRLSALELIPLLSFAFQRGKCRHCRAPIAWFHPAIELAALAIALASLYANGDTPRLWIDAALGWTLLYAAWVDAQSFRLPDPVTLPLILAGLAVTWAEQPGAIYNHAAAAALGYCGFRLLDAVYFALRRRHGLGQGDAKLLAAAGAWAGLAPLPYILILSGLAGIAFALLTRRQSQPIPFGPALALAFFLCRLVF